MIESSRPRVAIVGSGIAGLSAALGLQDACDVIVFEKRSRVGGHILPVAVEDPRGASAAVDTGFVVFVPETYPRFVSLLDWLEVPHASAKTPFRITDDVRALSFPAAELLPLCGRAIPKACRRDLLRVYQALQRIRAEGLGWLDNVSVQAWAEAQGFQPESVELGVVPWVASFWGLRPQTVLSVSAPVALREIARNAGHGTMHRVVPDTQRYLDVLRQRVTAQVRHVEVESIALDAAPAVLTREGAERFDHVVVSTDAMDARRLLANVPGVSDGLAPIRYEDTVAVVHHDASLLPASKAKWCTFHHRRRRQGNATHAFTTWVFDLLHEWTDDPTRIDTPTLLTTGSPELLESGCIDSEQILEVFEHRHLVSTPQVVDTLPTLPGLCKGHPVTLAASYLGLGALHEDALIAGTTGADRVRAALNLPPMRWPF
ncbi:MAG: NAD(P)-binding protein [Nannocystaceae bacterium]|nr:NAD(P)-binding protein [bacterium]